MKFGRTGKQKQVRMSSTSNWWKGKVNLLTIPRVELVFCVQIWRQNLFDSKFRWESKFEVELFVYISFHLLHIGVPK